MGKKFLIIVLLASTGSSQEVSPQVAAAARQMEQTQAAMAVSVQKQVASFRKPGKVVGASTSAGFFVTESDLALTPGEGTSDCDVMPALQLENLVTKAAVAERVSPDLIRAVIQQESGGRPCAISSKGAMGLMQLMPGTAGDLGVDDALDAESNILGGAKFLRKLLDRYSGDINRALGAYNAGPERVDEFHGLPPFPETMNYVDTIMRALDAPKLPH